MKKTTLLMTLVLASSLMGCSQQKVARQNVEKKMEEVQIENKPASETAHDFIMSSDSLTAVQKTKLMELQSKVHAENSLIKEQIAKAKQVMVQTVLEPKMNEREFKILKKKITSLEKQRMENGFKAVTEARLIIDPKNNLEGREVYKTYMIKRLQEF
ncbi:MAG: hypothetical protein WC635_03415 [Bacteriovorax sp.]|jgi:hypothetical protein